MHVTVDSSNKDKRVETEQASHSVKDVLHRFADETTAHGIPRIISRPRFLSKLLWSVLVIASLVLFFLQTSKLLSNYYTFNTRMEVIHSEEVMFPAITVCNLNRMKKSLMAKNERWKETVMLDDGYKFQISFPTNPTPLNTPSSSPMKESQDDSRNSGIRDKRETSRKPTPTDDEYWYYDNSESQDDEFVADFDFNMYGIQQSPTGNNLSLAESPDIPRFEKLALASNPTRQELKEMGHRVEDFIVQCKFNNRICDYTDFETTQNKHYGNCFTFNGGGANDSSFARVTKAGSSYGLHLTVFLEHHEYVGLLTEESGIRLIAHPRNIYPHPEDVGLSVAPGFSTSIGIRKIEIKRLPAPYGNCVDLGGSHNYLHNGTHAYSILSCQKKCLLDKMATRCSCATNIYDEYENLSQCGLNERRCRQSVEKEFYSNEMKCSCPAPCHEYVYSTQATSSLWPSTNYHRQLKEKLGNKWNLLRAMENVTTTRENLVRLKIYFQELNYELVEQIPAHTIESVSGTTGGLLGLYVGFSVITIGEFFVLLYDILALVVKRS